MASDDQPGAPGPAATDAGGLDFDKATFAGPVTGKLCAACQQNIPNEYYAAGAQIICPSCRNRLTGQNPDRWAFWRALLYGGLAGVAGTVVWSLIIHFTGYELGLIAIAVGIGVGIAVRKGSRGRGGWRYQALAMVLTYVSITTSYVPIIIKGVASGGKGGGAVTATADPTTATPGSADEIATVPTRHGNDAQPAGALPTPLAIVAFLALVWGLALAAPFLAGVSNIMGILIIAIGLYEAWKLNRAVPISGPFRLAPTVAAPPVGTATP